MLSANSSQQLEADASEVWKVVFERYLIFIHSSNTHVAASNTDTSLQERSDTGTH